MSIETQPGTRLGVDGPRLDADVPPHLQPVTPKSDRELGDEDLAGYGRESGANGPDALDRIKHTIGAVGVTDVGRFKKRSPFFDWMPFEIKIEPLNKDKKR